MTGYTLYGRPGGGSDAPRILLEELKLPYEFVAVGKEPGEVADYATKICPTGKIPALVLPDGTKMFESAAMLILLAGLHPDGGLAPKPGTPEHAKFLQWMVFLSANLYEAALRIYYSARYSAGGEAHASDVNAQATLDFERHLAVVEQALSPYLLGKDLSAADIYLYMLATWFPAGTDALAAKFPKLGHLIAAVAARPSVVKVAEAAA